MGKKRRLSNKRLKSVVKKSDSGKNYLVKINKFPAQNKQRKPKWFSFFFYIVFQKKEKKKKKKFRIIYVL